MLTIIDARNPTYGDEEKTFVSLEVKFLEIQETENEGFVHFTASPGDCEIHGRILYENAIMGIYGGAPSPYVASPPIVPESATAYQIRKAMSALQLRESFEAWLYSQESFTLKDYWEYEPIVLRSADIWIEWATTFATGGDELVNSIFSLSASV